MTYSPFRPVLGLLAITTVVAALGCKDLTGTPGLPSGTPNPSYYNNQAGALGMRNAAIYEVEHALATYIVESGLLTDELEDNSTGVSSGALLQNGGAVTDPLDERLLPVGIETTGSFGIGSYGELQAIRSYSTQALGALVTYDTATAQRDSAAILRGELYAMEGFAEIMLADQYCSGVPLTYLVYGGDFMYLPGSTTAQLYQDAIAKFDTAITLAHASDSVVDLAQVGQGRANLDLGKYAAAADDVVNIPNGFQYQLSVPWGSQGAQGNNVLNSLATVADSEGRNGLPFLSHVDPRSTVDTVVPVNPSGGAPYIPLTFPKKYAAALSGSGYAPFALASGVEARLIQAEAALNANPSDGTWLSILNTLRATVSLGPIADPGSGNPVAQIDTLFTERAEWLFLTGHRQGDLRRLLRNYGTRYQALSSQQQLYPTGKYYGLGSSLYGTDVVVPVPESESANPYFHGCLSNAP